MSENTDGKNVKIFISYAREDYETAKKLYNDLKAAGAEPWMDKIDILAGQRWKPAISSAIKNCQYFLLLLSSTSVSKQGFFHKEMRIALEVLESLPQSEIFLIPVRTDECRPPHEMLEELQWVDLFPSYGEGLEKILRAVKSGRKMEIPISNSRDENRESPVSPQRQESEIKREKPEIADSAESGAEKKILEVNESNAGIVGDGAKVEGGIHIHNYGTVNKNRNTGNKAAWKILALLIVFIAVYLLVTHVDWKEFFPPKKYSLTIISDPADAKVRIADPETAYFPGVKLHPGIYQIEVSHPDFETETRKIEIKSKDFSESVRLKSKQDDIKPVTGKSDKPVSPVEPVKPVEKEIQNTQPFTNSIGMKFVYIKPGTFIMGSPKEEEGHQDNETQHEVTLTKGFYMQTTEVTVGQWRAFAKAANYKSEAEMGGGAYVWTGEEWAVKEGIYWDNPGFSQTENYPVTCVSWNDVQKFAAWLKQKEGKEYRLPTEAEWEYAARAGMDTPFAFGKCLSTDQANYYGNYPPEGCTKGMYREKTVSVGSLKANAWGLYDMHGNVWEWCQDWYGGYPANSVTNPEGPGTGSDRVIRGGGWGSGAVYCRSAYRNRLSPGYREGYLGFRSVLSAGQQ